MAWVTYSGWPELTAPPHRCRPGRRGSKPWRGWRTGDRVLRQVWLEQPERCRRVTVWAGVAWAAAVSDGANREHAAASESQRGGSKCFVLIILRSSMPFEPGERASIIIPVCTGNEWLHRQMAEPTCLLLKTILPVIGRSRSGGVRQFRRLVTAQRRANQGTERPGLCFCGIARHRLNAQFNGGSGGCR